MKFDGVPYPPESLLFVYSESRLETVLWYRGGRMKFLAHLLTLTLLSCPRLPSRSGSAECLSASQSGQPHRQRKISLSFRLVHNFRSASRATESRSGLTFRASWGHTERQRMQEMHACFSTFFGSFLSMACTGHAAAHTPHFVHAFVGLGTMPTAPAFR